MEETGEQPGETSEEEDFEKDENENFEDVGSEGYVDDEVSFSNNNTMTEAKNRKGQTKSKHGVEEVDMIQGAEVENFEIDDEEKKSMMKFAKFLQSQGFLRVPEDNTRTRSIVDQKEITTTANKAKGTAENENPRPSTSGYASQ